MLNDTQKHPSEDELLLLAYGELPEARTTEVESHLAACAACHGQFAGLERGRVAADWALARAPRRAVRWAALAVAVAAVLAAVLLTARRSGDEVPSVWPQQLEWSPTAGYIAGGQAVIVIDSQLTRLEQERPYALP